MFFWKKKSKKKKKDKGKPSREELIAQAKANARAARENIGEDTLDRIAEAMKKKQQSALEKAKEEIKNTDRETVVDNLRWMMDDKK